MGVSWVLQWVQSGPVSGRHVVEAICEALEALSGSSRKRFWVTVAGLKVVQAEGQAHSGFPRGNDLFVVNCSDKPESILLLLRQQRQLLEAETAITGVLAKISTHKSRYSLSLEGYRYNLGDFRVAVCQATNKTSGDFKGIVVEVEYAAVNSIELGQPVLQEFVGVLQSVTSSGASKGRLEVVQAPVLEYPLPRTFSLQHRLVQYMTVCHLLMTQ